MKTIIISASRRTDIPAFYGDWFMKRIREGYCTVFNPVNRNQVTKVSLKPNEVDVLVFWTKNPQPFLPYLEELDSMGYRYYFQYTLNSYPIELEPHIPDLRSRIQTLQSLAEIIGPDRVIWRYDPIMISNITGYDYHKKVFQEIAEGLKGSTKRVVISLVDSYRKASSQFKLLAKEGVHISEGIDSIYLEDLMRTLVRISSKNGFEIFSCAETIDLSPFGVLPGKCIDDQYIKRVFGVNVISRKDKYQRLECGCVQSKDVGVYATCLHGCKYCYAGTIQASLKNYKEHEPDSPSLIGHYEVR
ncbi:MAG: DUF1848 domain-containing protein [Desulfitobacteriaceae bacterium]|nr:DUF1848 domain-containing protein [Desulfitobacteriaceae bacterium]MDI6914208.1 DUF1848 domain-containing protein [Desulfitobacteriaceae bacterium]